MKPSPEKIAEALSFIPKQQDYSDWLAVLAAVHSEYPNSTGIALCEAWSPGTKGEVNKKFKSFKRNSGVGIGTLFYQAQQHGWKPTRNGTQQRRSKQYAAPAPVDTTDLVASVGSALRRMMATPAAPAVVSDSADSVILWPHGSIAFVIWDQWQRTPDGILCTYTESDRPYVFDAMEWLQDVTEEADRLGGVVDVAQHAHDIPDSWVAVPEGAAIVDSGVVVVRV